MRVHYTGRLDDGTVFDSSEGREPLQFTLGESQVIPGFEDAVTGMQPGENKTAKIPSGQAYGPRRDDLLVNVDRSQFPEGMEPEIGQQLHLQGQGDRPIPVVVSEVREDRVLLDANHPLAGRDLTFDIRLLEIV